MATVADLYAVCGSDATDLGGPPDFTAGLVIRCDSMTALCRQEEKPALSLPMVRTANEESPA